MTSSGRSKLVTELHQALEALQSESLRNLSIAGMGLLLTITVSAILLEKLGLIDTGTGKIGGSKND